jgi:Xaa-Pro dipeptidase
MKCLGKNCGNLFLNKRLNDSRKQKLNVERLRKYRIARTNEAMKEDALDALVCTTTDNVKYIADCRTYLTPVLHNNAYLVVIKLGENPIVNGPIIEGAPMGLAPEVKGWKGYPMIPFQDIPNRWAKMIATVLEEYGVKSGRVGIDDMSFIIKNELTSLHRAEFVPAYHTMLKARSIKNEDELDIQRKVARITSLGGEAGLKAIRPGVTEREVVAEISYAMYIAGSEGEPWAAALSSGLRTLTSFYATDRKIRNGDTASFDIGGVWHGYFGDMTRTGAAGKPIREKRLVFTAVLNALKAGAKAVRPGVLCSEIDRVMREEIIDAGFEPPALTTGHGVGVSSPEIPWIGPKEEGIADYELKPGMVIAIEPRVGKAGVSAAGLEDMIPVTESGHRVLTTCSRQEHLAVK